VSDLARAIVCVGGAAWLLHSGWGVLATAIAYTLGAMAEVVVQGIAIGFALPRLARARFSWRPQLVRNAFDSGKWLSLAFGGIVVFSALDTVVISLMLSARDVAAYQIALPTATILYSLMIAAGLSLLPAVKTLWLRGERAMLTDGIERLYEAGIGVMLPLGVVLACGSDVLMTALFGDSILNAREAFDVMAVGGIAFFIAYINLHILAGIDQGRAAGTSVAAGLALYILLLPVLTYFLGIRGAALAGIAGYGAAATLSLYGIQRCLHVRLFSGRIAGVAVVSAVLGLAGVGSRWLNFIALDRPVLSGAFGLALGFTALATSEFMGFTNFRHFLHSPVTLEASTNIPRNL